MRGLADEGLAIVVISSYRPEVPALSDRILVAKRGKIVEEIEVTEATAKRSFAPRSTRGSLEQ